VEDIVAVTAVEHVVPAAAADEVVAVEAADDVVGAEAVDDVAAGTADQDVGGRGECGEGAEHDAGPFDWGEHVSPTDLRAPEFTYAAV
jgi:hypothetical protein